MFIAKDAENGPKTRQIGHSQALALVGANMKGTQYKTPNTNKESNGTSQDIAVPGKECRIKISRQQLLPDYKSTPPKKGKTNHTD